MDAGTLIFATVLSLNFTLCFSILARTVARIGAEERTTVKHVVIQPNEIPEDEREN